MQDPLVPKDYEDKRGERGRRDMWSVYLTFPLYQDLEGRLYISNYV